MEANELKEHAEHAHRSGEKALGLTTALVAVVLSLATLLSHRAQTDEMLTLTHNVDDWNFYQAKHERAYMFGLDAELEAMQPNGNGEEAAVKNFQSSVEEECGVPATEGCTSPLLKKSSVLQTLLRPGKPDPSGQESPSSNPTSPAKNEPAEKRAQSPKEAATKEGAVQILDRAKEGEKEVSLLERKVDRYDGAELFLEISIVLCSIALLAESKVYWKISFITTAIGIAAAIWGLVLR